MASHFTPNISQIIAYSKEEAIRLHSPSIGPEHLLLGMLRQRGGRVRSLLTRLDADPSDIKKELEQRICGATRNKMPSHSDSAGDISTPGEINLNEHANNVLKLAVLEARIQHQSSVDDVHLLLGILHDIMRNGAKVVLENNNIKYADVVDALHSFDEPETDDSNTPDDENDDDDMEDSAEEAAEDIFFHKIMTREKHKSSGDSKTPILDNFGVDLTAAARRGALDPIVGRERELTRIIEILGRRKKNNPVLIGEPGVGKSAIVEGLAQRIVKRQTSPLLFNKRIINLDLTGLVAGTKYRGQFEERMKALIKEIEKNHDIIIFIDEIHNLVGAGSTPGSMDAANILKPALARGNMQCIGATTLDEYRNSIEKDGALERRFQKIIVDPTTSEETLAILHQLAGRYEEHHHVKYTEDALQACVTLTGRYITDRAFPDKAIDAMDETGSHIRLCKFNVPKEITDKEREIALAEERKKEAVKAQNYERAASYRDIKLRLERELKKMNKQWSEGINEAKEPVTGADVASMVSVMTGVPVERLGVSEGIMLKGMGATLRQSVVAQEKAIDKVVKAIQRNRVGLKDPNHPIGVFMFLGPTGVGKTYLAQKLAEFMFGSKDALIRVDMSEYSEEFNVSRLVGAPPGYVGYEQGGQLTERVRRHPYSIVLLDEIEKAHGNVFNTLLQVFDEGRLTDGTGRTIDFRNTVMIMTSNAGTRQLKDFAHGVGFTASSFGSGFATDEKDKEYARSIIQKALSRQFSPEFLNRVDEIIMFDQLDLKAIRQIVDIELAGLYPRVEALGYKLDISEAAKDFIATKGYDIQYGARPLKRAIQNLLEDGLGELIINGDINGGATIKVDKTTDKPELSFDAIPVPAGLPQL